MTRLPHRIRPLSRATLFGRFTPSSRLTLWTRLALPTRLTLPACLVLLTLTARCQFIQLIYTSDAHYGITRARFDGDSNTDAHIVNARMIARINALPSILLPQDKGLRAGLPVGAIDWLVESGDIANREELPIQDATSSWAQFTHDYINGLTLRDGNGRPTGLLLVPGNHDISNAVGFYKTMRPATDPGSMIGIYNRMMQPAIPKTAATYHYPADKISYSKDIGGIHFVFITLWPDSANRIWMEKDLQGIDPRTPVILVTHDQPECEAKHFRNPFGTHDVNAKDKFENLVEEVYKDKAEDNSQDGNNQDGSKQAKLTTDIEQRGFVAFLKRHPDIKAYFHGNSNWNQFYTYTGPDHDIALPVFRVDSPMKGRYSAKDETRLSFQLITIDTASKTMTVRECRWNPDPSHPEGPPSWGDSITIPL